MTETFAMTNDILAKYYEEVLESKEAIRRKYLDCPGDFVEVDNRATLEPVLAAGAKCKWCGRELKSSDICTHCGAPVEETPRPKYIFKSPTNWSEL